MPTFGLVFTPRSPDTVIRAARLMEELGFDLVGLVDSHSRAMDIYVAMTLVAANTSRLKVGPCVTNPVTRDLTVTAAAMASIELIAPGRTYLGISKGFSGTGAVGLRPTTTSAMADVIPQVRSLLAGERVTLDGRTAQLQWTRRPMPIYIAASGPKALAIGGRVADGVFVHMGHFPDVVADALGHVRRGAEDAGRDWRTLDLWLYGAAACAEDGAAARHAVKGAVAGMGTSVFSPTTHGKRVPRELEGAVAELRRQYAVTRHMDPSEEANEHLIDRLGLTDYLLDRFAFAGAPAEIRRKVQRLEALGIEQFLLNLSMSGDLERDIRLLAQALEPGRGALA